MSNNETIAILNYLEEKVDTLEKQVSQLESRLEKLEKKIHNVEDIANASFMKTSF